MDPDTIEHDLRLWLKTSNKQVVYNTYTTPIAKFSDECYEGFNDVVCHLKNIRYIDYVSFEDTFIGMRINSKNEIISISFNFLKKYDPGNFYPWVEIKEDSLTFHHIEYPNNNTKSDTIDLTQIKNIRDFYSKIKILNLSFALDKYRDKIEAYYDSLPPFKMITCVIEELCYFPQGDIIIEI